MGDVAEAVAIGPSALYRHFRGKQDLLATVVGGALDTLDDAFTAAEDERLSDVAATLAAAVLSHRGAGCCGSARPGSSPAATAAKFRAAIDQIAARFAALIRARRPGLVRVERSCLPGRGSRSRPACRCTASSCLNPNSPLCSAD